MNTTSVWQGTAAPSGFAPLQGDLQADVAVVGGGITGVTLAHRLAGEGRSVVLLEAHEIGGTTGRSTGNLYQSLSRGLHALERTWDAETVRAVAAARGEAVMHIERQARQLDVDCGFRRCAHVWFAGSPGGEETVRREHDAALAAGLAARWDDTLPPPFATPATPALVIDHQAQFHPLVYVRALAQQAAARGARVHEHSAALEVDAAQRTVRTAGGKVAAGEIVLATHSPLGVHRVQTGMVPSQEYGGAWAVADAVPPGIYWQLGTDTLSVRGLEWAGTNYLIAVGQQHKTAQHDAGDALAQLESLAHRRFGDGEAAFRWSAQNFRSPDGLPYIGQDGSGLFIATGFATDGLVWGTLAAALIADRILGRDNAYADLFKASRLTVVKSAKGLVEETANTVRALAQDYLTPAEQRSVAALAPGAGAIVEVEGRSLGAWRAPDGELFVVSPVCTHLKCRVRWNAVQTSWDCPCHGSRFAPDGRVIEGPALRPLERRAVER